MVRVLIVYLSGGLKPTGPPNGNCAKSVGQVYARAAEYNGAYAIMYSWLANAMPVRAN